jgi:hypothetical protein
VASTASIFSVTKPAEGRFGFTVPVRIFYSPLDIGGVGDMSSSIDLERSQQMSWTRNQLLLRLPDEDAHMLRPNFEPVKLKQGEVLFDAYETISHVHFFEGGLSSEIAGLEQSRSTEVGCIGFEGFSAVPAVLGVDRTPHHAFMQCGGPALRIETSALRSAMNESLLLRELLLKYAHVFLIQVAATALADSRYDVGQRLATNFRLPTISCR